jgi:hypothetical protein
MTSASFLIGIDLGTTNCTMAYAQIGDTSEDSAEIHSFAIPQITQCGTEDSISSLPSFLYFSLEEELKSQSLGVSWDPRREYCLGQHAKERGAELPKQVVASAKSWLCHSGIDRRAALLPKEEGRISPLDACSALLQHLREAWDQEHAKDAPFTEQKILVTVPASFDPSARQLVQEAAEIAGFPKILLLEEPQAALYAWLHAQEDKWRSQVSVDDHVLVVDVGGGTTDFTLVKVGEESGDLNLERVAVGAHLLLGGDNMDLALAYLAKSKLEEAGNVIDDWQLQSLIHHCRKAKEQLLAENPEEKIDITIQGRGSRLIGGSLTTSITAKEAQNLLVDGFIPMLKANERAKNERKSGLQELGLPYAQDPRISSQLAQFLSMTGESDSDSMDKFIMPSAILFNGGTMKAPQLRTRLVDVLNSWAKELKTDPVNVLPDPEYDFAVSRGAVYYGLAREGKGVRIKGGTSRSYFIAVEGAAPAVPGIPAPLNAICVVPFGMEEGSEEELPGQEFALVVGETASFRFFSRQTATLSNGEEALCGKVVKNWRSELTELHPLETRLEKESEDGKTICVKLKSRVNELGVLELCCVAKDGREWNLEFDVRHEAEALALL